jgi:hypothetical protein
MDNGEYERRLKEQGGVCAICGKPESKQIKGRLVRLAVDHCHTRECVRDLLCNRCNVVLGFVRDNREVLQAMIEYLRRHEAAG